MRWYEKEFKCRPRAVEFTISLSVALACSGCLILSAPLALAQQILAPRPEIIDESLTLRQRYDPDRFRRALPSQLAPAPPPTLSPVVREKKGLIELGPVIARPHLGYQFLYGDGLSGRRGNEEKTIVQEVSPGLLLELGQYWQLEYSPGLRFYSSDDFQNTVSHSVSFRGSMPLGGWVVGVSQGYSASSDPLIETGLQTDQESFSTTVFGTYKYSLKSSFDLSASQSIQSAASFIDSRSWTANGWWNYQAAQNTEVGLGAVFGYVDVQPGTDMTFEQAQARVNWNPTQRIFAQVSGGIEMRQFLDVGLSDRINPLFSVTFGYTPFEQTTISFSASRRVDTSLFSSQIIENTNLTGSFRQRFLSRFYLNVSGGFAVSEFQASVPDVEIAREDSYTFFSVRLSTTWRKRGTVGVFYHQSENSSGAAGFGFDSTQVGFDIGYRF